MELLLKYLLISVSQIMSLICAFVMGFSQIPMLYLMLTNQAKEGDRIFMDEVAPNLDDLIFRSLITFFIFALLCFIAYKGKKYLSKNKN